MSPLNMGMNKFIAKRKPPPLEVVYNIYKKINSKAMPLKAFWLGKSHLLCRWSFTDFLDIIFIHRGFSKRHEYLF